jgi:predicted RNA binding protein YcfA (HicA-like mRNA interferase family)
MRVQFLEGTAELLGLKQLLTALGKAGFMLMRVRGSHHLAATSRRPQHRCACPFRRNHRGPGLLTKILRDADLSFQQLVEFLD